MAIEVRLFDSFANVEPESWELLLEQSATNTQFSTRQWQTAWWDSLGRGSLVVATAFRSGAPVLTAPLFIDGGMGFFGGSGSSDYLDFIGRVEDGAAMDALLSRVADEIPGFVGFRFHHVPDASPTGRVLAESASRLGLECYDEGQLGALPAGTVADAIVSSPPFVT